jgi:hypothetical protein
MSNIGFDDVYTATWGSYFISALRGQDGTWKGRIHDTTGWASESLSLVGLDSVRQWAARTLESRGCEAFVSGRKQSLDLFIVFVPSGLEAV